MQSYYWFSSNLNANEASITAPQYQLQDVINFADFESSYIILLHIYILDLARLS